MTEAAFLTKSIECKSSKPWNAMAVSRLAALLSGAIRVSNLGISR